MRRPHYCSLVALVTAIAASPAAAEEAIKDYLFTHAAGPVAANDIIGVNKNVVSDLQTPRDIALSLGNIGDQDTQNGFGISFTPGRSGFRLVAVAADKYREGDLLRRIWSGTTFSYAQNRKKMGGADYDQSAVAVSTTFLLRADQDPIIVAYDALSISEGSSIKCKVSQEALEAASRKAEAEQRRLVDEFPLRNGGQLPNRVQLEDIQKQTTAQRDAEVKALSELRSCAFRVAADVEKVWNASRFHLMLGRGWIKPADGSGERVRLATQAKLSMALGVRDDGLVNLTWRRVGDDLDMNTLGGTLAFKNTNSAAIRFTYKATKRADTYAIAEVSNVKASTTTSSQADYRQALGIDRMVAPGLWLEFRYGRARSMNGTALENKALLSLKFSEDTSLEKEAR